MIFPHTYICPVPGSSGYPIVFSMASVASVEISHRRMLSAENGIKSENPRIRLMCRTPTTTKTDTNKTTAAIDFFCIFNFFASFLLKFKL